ncbi:nucleoside-diphosphate sugar epimerase/dehydratase [Limibacter armeniacum]|uniref:polysaccharide biosynthesis protein n=1 Tax=Limibacter armeniacum TaxID=466084 RepID=UPI002FE60D46
MKTKSKRFFQRTFHAGRFIPRWYVLAIDLISVSLAFVLAIIIRFNFDFQQSSDYISTDQAVYIAFLYVLGFYYKKSFAGTIRHTSLQDLVKIFSATSLSTMLILSLTIVGRELASNSVMDLPISITIITYLMSTAILIASRLIFRAGYNMLYYNKMPVRNVLVYGAGSAGIITKEVLERDSSCNYSVKAFVDDNKSKKGKSLGGVTIYSSKQALNEEFMLKHDIDEIIIAIQRISSPKRRKIIDTCLGLDLDIEIRNVPPVNHWINGELSAKQIKSVRIEDLLDRDPIKLEKENIANEVRGKVLMVTGAAGSIGGEISKQLTHYQPTDLILLDQSETGLYDIERHVQALLIGKDIRLHILIADISNRQRIEEIFTTYSPDIIYHAAAYKHVPMMEKNPSEAIMVNVKGSKNIADMAVKYKAEKFVMVSTDKAVNPTNVMGASKRIAEIYTQSLGKDSKTKTKFVTTRFGNVLGSNGSVIPLFREQIAKGGPLTVTSDKITRYFMTIPEACQLVLEAGAMGNGGEIFVFDMGESVRIIDIAKKMIRLSGLEEGKDIDIKVTGLRPGEKLYEELLNNEENTMPTHHPKIMIGKVRKYDYGEASELVDLLIETATSKDDWEIVKSMKVIVPEYVSNNSIFEKLDSRPNIELKVLSRKGTLVS